MLLTIPLTILVQWIGMAGQVNILEKERTDAELQLLKQQINPHFFFNTLNNIYSMSRKNNVDTPEAILQLSDLMRYVIYKGKEKTLPLSAEIKYLKDYVKLQKLRLYQNFNFRFDINIESEDTQVSPLLFIILVENAFKHGIEVANEESFLNLILLQQGRKIEFTCINSIEEVSIQSDKGMGLENLNRRLKLIYPDSHELHIERTKLEYNARLTIEF